MKIRARRFGNMVLGYIGGAPVAWYRWDTNDIGVDEQEPNIEEL